MHHTHCTPPEYVKCDDKESWIWIETVHWKRRSLKLIQTQQKWVNFNSVEVKSVTSLTSSTSVHTVCKQWWKNNYIYYWTVLTTEVQYSPLLQESGGFWPEWRTEFVVFPLTYYTCWMQYLYFLYFCMCNFKIYLCYFVSDYRALNTDCGKPHPWIHYPIDLKSCSTNYPQCAPDHFSPYNFEVLVLECLYFMLLYTSTPLQFRGKYCTLHSTTFMW